MFVLLLCVLHTLFNILLVLPFLHWDKSVQFNSLTKSTLNTPNLAVTPVMPLLYASDASDASELYRTMIL